MRLQPPKQDEHAMEDTEFRLALMMRLRQPVLTEAMPCMHCNDTSDHQCPSEADVHGGYVLHCPRSTATQCRCQNGGGHSQGGPGGSGRLGAGDDKGADGRGRPQAGRGTHLADPVAGETSKRRRLSRARRSARTQRPKWAALRPKSPRWQSAGTGKQRQRRPSSWRRWAAPTLTSWR